jgi:CDP-archaeol synthase
MIDIERATHGFLLIAVANSTPWALGRLCGDRWAAPLDFGLVLRDGERLFGAHKTWRGLIAGVLACGVVSEALASGYLLGMGVGVIALLADALSSAAKRRLRRAPGSEIPGLDQLPESVLPLAAFASPLELGIWEIAAASGMFLALDILLMRLRHPVG